MSDTTRKTLKDISGNIVVISTDNIVPSEIDLSSFKNDDADKFTKVSEVNSLLSPITIDVNDLKTKTTKISYDASSGTTISSDLTLTTGTVRTKINNTYYTGFSFSSSALLLGNASFPIKLYGNQDRPVFINYRGGLQEHNIALISDIPTVPTKTSDLTNDSGFITSSFLTDYVTKSYGKDNYYSYLSNGTRIGATEETPKDVNTVEFLVPGKYWETSGKAPYVSNIPNTTSTFVLTVENITDSSTTPSTQTWRTFVRHYIDNTGTYEQLVKGTSQAGVYTYDSWKKMTEPDNYIKNASVSNNVLTLTKQDNTTITFTGGGSGSSLTSLVDYNSIPASGQTSVGNGITGVNSIQGNAYARSKPSGCSNIVIGRSKNNSSDSGTNPDVQGCFNLSFGNKNTINGIGCLAVGGTNHVGLSSMDWSGISSSGFDEDKVRLGCFAYGLFNTSSGKRTMTGGFENTASGENSIALGYQSESTALNSFALGKQCKAKSANSQAYGHKNVAGDDSGLVGWIGYATSSTVTKTITTSGIISINDYFTQKGTPSISVSDNTTDSSTKTLTLTISGESLTQYNDSLFKVSYSINNNIIKQAISSNTFTKTVSTTGVINVTSSTTDKGTITVEVSNNTPSQTATDKVITVTITDATISSSNPANIEVNWTITNTPTPEPTLPEHYSCSHAEGQSTTAFGKMSHSEGASTGSLGEASHAEGGTTIAFGNYSHSEGIRTQAIGVASHSMGIDTKAKGYAQTVCGRNNSDNNNALFIVGNGNSSVNQNAFEVLTDGTLRIPNFTDNTLQTRSGYKRVVCINGVLTILN